MEDNIGKKYFLKLYIYGMTDKSESALRILKRISERYLDGKCTFEVIDLAENSDLGHEDGILATPTLIRKFPLPERRIIGDLSKIEEVVSSIVLTDE